MADPTSNGGGAVLPFEFLDVLQSVQHARFGAAAATTLYIYDILITFDIEVEHTWPRLGFNLPMVFYVLNRYVSLIFFLFMVHAVSDLRGPLSDTYCRTPFLNVGLILAHISWTGVMTLRVCALWKQRPALVIVIRILWALTIIAVVICALTSYISQIPILSYHQEIGMCSPNRPNLVGLENAGLYAPIAPLLFETFLAALTIIKAFDFRLQTSWTSFHNLPFFYRILARDGGLYFLVTIVITAATLVSWFTHLGPEVYLFGLIYWSLLSTVISRLALNLRLRFFESRQVTKTLSFEITNADSGITGDIGQRSETATKDVDARAIQGWPSRDDAEIEMESPAINEPEGTEEEDQCGIEHAGPGGPSLAMQCLSPRNDGIGAV